MIVQIFSIVDYETVIFVHFDMWIKIVNKALVLETSKILPKFKNYKITFQIKYLHKEEHL